ncbi:GNAT family N-acetyltransferase [Tepidamorphus sp. 3E244]|uniref:GNAT family N-acetyltransferase n=1 Tax=Tepidamorphus sp. 3E244 TaxID=3385498 RepID=UPI0038FCFF92
MNAQSQPIHCQRLGWSELASRVDDWRKLAENAATPNIFYHPDFALPAAEALGVGNALQAIAAFTGEELVGLMPMRVRNRWGLPFPIVEAWTHPNAPASLPLVARAQAEAATIALFDAITADRGLPGIVLLPTLLLDSPFAAALLSVRKPLYVHSGHQRAVAREPLSGDDYLAHAMSGSRRKKLRQQFAGLEAEGIVSVTAAASPHEASEALDAFLALEVGGWKGEAGTALARDDTTLTLARDVVQRLAEGGMARIFVMSLDGKPIASLIAFTEGTTAWLWKIAYDEAYAKHSPGKHLFMAAVRMLRDENPDMLIDSCAQPNHPLADLVLGEHMAMGDVVVSAGGRAGPAFRTANLLERLRGQARRLKHKLKG